MITAERKAEILTGIVGTILGDKGLGDSENIEEIGELVSELLKQLHASGLKNVTMGELKEVCGEIMRRHIDGVRNRLEAALSKIE